MSDNISRSRIFKEFRKMMHESANDSKKTISENQKNEIRAKAIRHKLSSTETQKDDIER